MPELVIQAPGPGRLDLRGDMDAAALLFDGAPVAVVWRDGDLTSFVRHHSTHLLDEPGRLPPVCREGVDPDVPLDDQLEPLLGALPRGTYEVSMLPSMGLDELPPTPRPSDWAGPHSVDAEDVLLGTRPRHQVDATEIDAAARKLQRGHALAVVLLTYDDSPVTFLIAGHGVLEAAGRAGVAPAAVVLTLRAPASLSQDEHLLLLRQMLR